MIKIDKGIPMPTKGGDRTKYPLAQMEVGDSFAFPADKVMSLRALVLYHKRHGRQFTVSCKKGESEGRCWRIK